MSNQVRPYEPLTSQNAALVLVDHQVGLMTGVRDYSTGELKHNVVALAKAAKALKLPIVVTTRRVTACGVRHSPNSWKLCQASRSSTVHRSKFSTTPA
jgi:nicotinamidase-related amidase